MSFQRVSSETLFSYELGRRCCNREKNAQFKKEGIDFLQYPVIIITMKKTSCRRSGKAQRGTQGETNEDSIAESYEEIPGPE